MSFRLDMTRRRFAASTTGLLLSSVLRGAQPEQESTNGPFETTSRLGRKLYALPDSDGAIQAARAALAADPQNGALALKLSKAQAAKRQYQEAVKTCTLALKSAPRDGQLYLERGHRELGLREFKAGLADLNRAVELGPNDLDSHYHQGTAHYFLREFDQAAQSFGDALKLAKNNDSVIDCSNWQYVSLRRAGQAAAAANVLKRITPDVKNTEPHLYFYLRLLHFYQGKLSETEVIPAKPSGPADVEGELSFNTINYGVGNWHLYDKNDAAGAREYFTRVMKGHAWNSWGFIGSELELAQK